MAVQTRTIDYTDGGTSLEGYLPGMTSSLACDPACWLCTLAGRSPFEDEVARKLAALGYAALAMDVYGKGVLGGGPKENTKLMTPFLEDRSMLQNRLKTGLQVLRDQAETDAGKVAATGYCFGGLCVLDLARTGEDFQGAASFHGLFNKPGNTEVRSDQGQDSGLARLGRSDGAARRCRRTGGRTYRRRCGLADPRLRQHVARLY